MWVGVGKELIPCDSKVVWNMYFANRNVLFIVLYLKKKKKVFSDTVVKQEETTNSSLCSLMHEMHSKSPLKNYSVNNVDSLHLFHICCSKVVKH